MPSKTPKQESKGDFLSWFNGPWTAIWAIVGAVGVGFTCGTIYKELKHSAELNKMQIECNARIHAEINRMREANENENRRRIENIEILLKDISDGK